MFFRFFHELQLFYSADRGDGDTTVDKNVASVAGLVLKQALLAPEQFVVLSR